MKNLLTVSLMSVAILAGGAVSYATSTDASFDDTLQSITTLKQTLSQSSCGSGGMPIIFVTDESDYKVYPEEDINPDFDHTLSAIAGLKSLLAEEEEEIVPPIVMEEERHAAAQPMVLPVVDFDATLSAIAGLKSLLAEDVHMAASDASSLDQLEFGDVEVPALSYTDQARQLLMLLNEKYDALKAEVEDLKQSQLTDGRFTDTQNVFLTFLASLRSKEPDMYTRLLLDMTDLFKEYQVEYME